ncbi:MAG: YajG family lipoprotein [Victivallales bacterium]|jgi:hypothetical protein
MKRMFLVLVCLSVIAVLFGCSSTPPKMLTDVPLVWKPTKSVYDSDTVTATGLFSQQYKVMPFTDNRTNKAEIARNIEDNNVKLVTTRDDVADWCRSRFIDIIKQRGFNVVEDKADATIKGEIAEFYVIESNVYTGNLAIKVTVENASGKILWQGMTAGVTKRFGRSYKLENYQETLSDAFLDAVKGLLKNPEFISALQKK